MSIKDILFLTDSRSSTTGAYSLSLASIFDAHLTAAGLVVDLTGPNAREMLSYDVFVSDIETRKAAMYSELDRLARKARLNGVQTEVNVLTAFQGTAREVLARFARLFDLAIIEQSNPAKKQNRDLELEAVLFGSGRPIIVVPYDCKSPLQLTTVLVAWDGSSVAARAIGDAMPLLARARDVQIIRVVDRPDKNIEIGEVEIARHLARHDVNAELKILPATDVAKTVLSHASACDADLLVMGGYGHSRHREMFFGGTTREVLMTTTLPVFMSH
jgi:nucleotide-binding universal stress UspA family protein